PTTACPRPALQSAAIWTSTTVADRMRALTASHPIKPTSPRCPSAWQPNHGRGSTYRCGKSVQTTGTTSRCFFGFRPRLFGMGWHGSVRAPLNLSIYPPLVNVVQRVLSCPGGYGAGREKAAAVLHRFESYMRRARRMLSGTSSEIVVDQRSQSLPY